MTRKDAPDPRAGGLALLVETEDRLEAMLVLRREEAEGLLEEARLRAAERLRSLDHEIAARAAHLQREIEERAAAAAREAAIEGARRSARWRDVPEGRLDELAGLVIERLLNAVGRGRVIVPMARARVLGPRERLEDVLRAVQDTRLLHLADPPPVGPLRPAERVGRSRETRHLRSALADVDAVLARFPGAIRSEPPPGTAGTADFARWARASRRLRRRLDGIGERRRALLRERADLDLYERFFVAFASLVPDGARARLDRRVPRVRPDPGGRRGQGRTSGNARSLASTSSRSRPASSRSRPTTGYG